MMKGFKVFFKTTAVANSADDTYESVTEQLETMFKEIEDFESKLI